ncbi:MAG: hypothetical protein HDT43_09000 [Ruminococcaceae bacterium]|nr:hypothetical protein [Oscillospiraceae bacterium]
MKKFKRIAAGVIAVATMAATGVSAFADDYKSRSWAVDYIKGAPSSVSTQLVDRVLYYYAGGYQSTCKKFDGGGDGYIGVYVSGTERWKITGEGTVPNNGYRGVSISDSVDGLVTFRIKADGNRVIGSGTIHQL